MVQVAIFFALATLISTTDFFQKKERNNFMRFRLVGKIFIWVDSCEASLLRSCCLGFHAVFVSFVWKPSTVYTSQDFQITLYQLVFIVAFCRVTQNPGR